MKLGTCRSKPGEITAGRWAVEPLPDGSLLELPVAIAEGTKPGPTAFVSGGMHGNELNGIELAHRFWRRFEREGWVKKMKGTVIFLPLLNPYGFLHHRRGIPLDRRDLNRSFGVAQPERSASTRIAQKILEGVVKSCDFGIDLHDSGRRNVLLPHTRVHRNDAAGTQTLGSLFGTDIVMIRDGAPGMLASTAQRQYGIPVVTVEIGGAMILWDDFLNRGLQGIRNVFIHQGMMSGKILLPPRQFFLEERSGYVAPISGIARGFWHLGDSVKAGDVLAEVYDPVTGRTEAILSEYCGVVFSRRMQARVDSGDEVLSVMELESCDHFPKGRSRHVRESRTFETLKGCETGQPLYPGNGCAGTIKTSG